MYKLLMRKYHLLMDNKPEFSDNSGIFSPIEKMIKKLFGNFNFLSLNTLGLFAISIGIVSLIVLVVSPEYRKKSLIAFLLCVFVSVLVYGGGLKEFFLGLGS